MPVRNSNFAPDKRRKYGDAFEAEAWYQASENRRPQAAAQQVGTGPKPL